VNFQYPEEMRKDIYTTNTIESLNSVIRKVTKKRKSSPTDDSAKKVIYLAIQQASKKLILLKRNWELALNQFMMLFEPRLTGFI
jgi:putative transposase